MGRKKARRHLAGKLNRLAKAHGFTFNRMSIRSQKTRCVSFSRNNNIRLSVKLAPHSCRAGWSVVKRYHPYAHQY
ncbi:YgjP-like metallopeptidase domain-containing protein [Chloroflexota bacterium]